MDETYFGNVAKPLKTRTDAKPFKGKPRGPANKRAVIALVQRGGELRSFHVGTADKFTVEAILEENVSREAHLMTDESRLYRGVDVAKHDTVQHSADEYVRYEKGKPVITTNTVEGYFSVFKRGMKGVYQHCAEKHLHRYLAEFDFRYNHRAALEIDDATRAAKMVIGAKGKRLTYRTTRDGAGELDAD